MGFQQELHSPEDYENLVSTLPVALRYGHLLFTLFMTSRNRSKSEAKAKAYEHIQCDHRILKGFQVSKLSIRRTQT